MSNRQFIAFAGLLAALGALAAGTLLRPAPPPTDWAEPLRAHRAPMPEPGPNDWLTDHPEPGQTIAEYQASDPVRPGARLTTIYVLPLGAFSPAERAALQQTADFMAAFFCLPVTVLPERPIGDLPQGARRESTLGFGPQLLTRYIVGRILLPTRPPDAVAYLAFTNMDLWPGEGWNFVYGEAYARARIGVWSFRRNGPPGSPIFMERTFKIAVHETGHILGLAHCTAWACVMNGVNHREEADAAPLSLCPEDMVKLAWNTGCDPRARLERLEARARAAGLAAARAFAQTRAQLGD